MRNITAVFAVALALFSAPRSVSAQPPPQVGKAAARATVDFRAGALWPGREAVFAPTKTRSSFGVRVAPYLGEGRVTHRLSLQFALDYIPVSKFDYFDEVLQSDVRYREQIVVVNPGLGFDIVQSPRVDIVVRFGGAAMANLTRLELPDIYGEYEDVCHLQAFRGACPSRWNFVGNGGASLRLFPKEDWPLYIGVDYTRYAAYKNQLVGTVGFAF